MKPLTRAGTLLAIGALFRGFWGFGCDGGAGCPELCAKQTECAPDLGVIAPPEAECVEQCEALSEDDPDYADSVADKAACVQEDGCDGLLFGCTPEP